MNNFSSLRFNAPGQCRTAGRRAILFCWLLAVCAFGLQAQLPPKSGIIASWPGMGQTGLIRPPDPHGSAGPSGIIQVVNLRVGDLLKKGTRNLGPTSFYSFFSSAAGAFASGPRPPDAPPTPPLYAENLGLPFNN